jgi:hypothetical protein
MKYLISKSQVPDEVLLEKQQLKLHRILQMIHLVVYEVSKPVSNKGSNSAIFQGMTDQNKYIRLLAHKLIGSSFS